MVEDILDYPEDHSSNTTSCSNPMEYNTLTSEKIKYTAISTEKLLEMMVELSQPIPVDFTVYKRPSGEKCKYEENGHFVKGQGWTEFK